MHTGPLGSTIHVIRADAATVVELAAIDWNRSFRRVCLDPVRGLITLMAPSRLHEELATILDHVVDVAASALGGAVKGLQTSRLREPGAPPGTGMEPDGAFYVGESQGLPRGARGRQGSRGPLAARRSSECRSPASRVPRSPRPKGTLWSHVLERTPAPHAGRRVGGGGPRAPQRDSRRANGRRGQHRAPSATWQRPRPRRGHLVHPFRMTTGSVATVMPCSTTVAMAEHASSRSSSIRSRASSAGRNPGAGVHEFARTE